MESGFILGSQASGLCLEKPRFLWQELVFLLPAQLSAAERIWDIASDFAHLTGFFMEPSLFSALGMGPQAWYTLHNTTQTLYHLATAPDLFFKHIFLFLFLF